MDVDVDSVEAELNTYTRVQKVPLDTDPLMWWKQHVQEFPRLTRMALVVAPDVRPSGGVGLTSDT